MSSTYNNEGTYNTTGSGFGNEGRGNTTSASGVGGTGSTFDDQESGQYGGSSSQENRGSNTGNTVGYMWSVFFRQ